VTVRPLHCPIQRLSPLDGGHYFFGYYDKCPWSPDQKLLLAHRATFAERLPGPDDHAHVGLIDEHAAFTPLDSTSAWNWQQGAQLAWIPRSSRIIFNIRPEPNRLAARILDHHGRRLADLDHPVAALSPDGVTAASLTFARLTACRPEYGYAGLTHPSVHHPAPDDDGLYRLDLRTGTRHLLVSIRQLVEHQPTPLASPTTVHHLNHPLFNRDGSRLCFLQRFLRDDGIQHSRLFTIGVDGSDLRLLFEGFVSHYDWLDDHTLVAWAGRRKLLDAGPRPLTRLARRALKPLYHALGKPRLLMSRVLKDSYLLIPDQHHPRTTPLALGHLTVDGHCSVSPDGTWLLTDGYPARGHQPLFLWNLRDSLGYRVGLYPCPARFDGPLRADLHPRFSRDARTVCIDSAMDGSRAIYAVDVSSLTART
jgi:hypothetical protein